MDPDSAGQNQWDPCGSGSETLLLTMSNDNFARNSSYLFLLATSHLRKATTYELMYVASSV